MLGVVSIALAGYMSRDAWEFSGRPPSAATGPGAGTVVEAMRPLMGTQFTVKVWVPPGREPGAAEAIRAALDEATELEERISGWRSDSETSQVNRAAGQAAVDVGADLLELLAISMRWARRTRGAFDVTGGPLFELWKAAREQGRLPSEQAIHERLARVGHELIEVRGETVRLRRAGMELGFGSVGKGFVADRAAAQLHSEGFSDFIIDAGGDLVCAGTRGGAPWNVGVQHPRQEKLLAHARLSGGAIATSGDYEQYLIVDGERFGHIIDPRSGWPVSAVTSVVVVASKCADADALATGLFVLGPDEGLVLVEKISSVEALFVMRGGGIRHSEGLSLVDGILKRIP